MDPTLLAQFEAHRPAVYGWALRILGRPEDAQDVAQDVFIRFLGRGDEQTLENPRGWLRRVTVNRALDLVRAQAARPLALADPEQLPAAGGDALGRASNQELRQAVNQAIQELTQAQRSVLIAKVFDGATFAQIAQEQGLAVPTVKTHYLRALSALKGRMGKQWDPARS